MYRLRRMNLTVAATLLAAFALCPRLAAGPLSRHVAEFNFGPEQIGVHTAAPNGGGGDLIYSKTLTLPTSAQTVFVTISTTGDTHDGDAAWFTASVNQVVCNPGDSGAGFAPTGWIPLQKHFSFEKVTYRSNGAGGLAGGDGGGGTGDMHDNGIYYTWCCIRGVKPGGTNTVQIKLATSKANEPVFIERSHFYIDSVPDRGLCAAAAAPAPNFEGVPATVKEELLRRIERQKAAQPAEKQPSQQQ